MQIKLHLMGPLKQKLAGKVCPEPNCYLEVPDGASPRGLLRLLDVDDDGVVILVNGKPVDPETQLSEGDRVVLMNPDSKET